MGKSYRTIWLDQSNPKEVKIINQLKLPFSFEIISLRSCKDACFAISEMQVRGAGLIGATAGFGMYLATLECSDHNFQEDLENFAKELIATRWPGMNPKMAQNGPKISQHGPRRLQDSYKTAPRQLNMSPGQLKQVWPSELGKQQDGPVWTQVGARWAQDGLR